MNKKFLSILVSACALGAGAVTAQEISSSDLQQIQASFEPDAATKALQNILMGNANLRSLALNHELEGQIDHYFKYRVDVKGITNQYQSGRCWMFTSMNVLRPTVMEQLQLNDFDFSHNYNYFWDIFEKSNLFLENVIASADHAMTDRDVEFYFKTPINDGGVWNLFYNIAEKYGVVPQDVMPETAHSNNTGQMSGVINERLRAGGYALRELIAQGAKSKAVKAQKMEILKDVYRILALCLGEPPTEFTWRYKNKDGEICTLKSTPKDFYRSIVPDDYSPDAYIMIMNDPTREYYKVYDIANYRNTVEGINWRYLNLPNDVIKQAALASIKANEAMYASCDVSAYYNSQTGISDPAMYDYEALFGIEMSMDKKARILTRESGSSHAMTLIAVDTDENDRPIKWEFENSWGPTAGHNGYLTFTDEWFDEYMFRLVINKRYLDAASQKAAEQKPIQLPAWDYMF